MEFTIIYYFTAASCILMIPIFVRGPNYQDYILPRTAIVCVITFVYGLGMIRVGGVDMDNYRYAFESDPTFIPDVGFQLLLEIYRALNLPFMVLMLSIATTNLYAIVRLARLFDLSLGLLLILWFLHIVVVRDFSQLRSSLAISLAIIGLTSNFSKVKWLLYSVSVSVHLTSFAFILAYECCRRVSLIASKRVQWILVGFFVFSTFVIAASLNRIAFLDGRIETYLSWAEEGYGASVGTYGFLILHGLICAIVLSSYGRWSLDPRLRTLFYLEVLGCATFIAFSNYSIFAFRLSNLITALYPVLFLGVVKASEKNRTRYTSIFQKIALLFVGLSLIVRPGSADIIARIKF